MRCRDCCKPIPDSARTAVGHYQIRRNRLVGTRDFSVGVPTDTLSSSASASTSVPAPRMQNRPMRTGPRIVQSTPTKLFAPTLTPPDTTRGTHWRRCARWLAPMRAGLDRVVLQDKAVLAARQIGKRRGAAADIGYEAIPGSAHLGAFLCPDAIHLGVTQRRSLSGHPGGIAARLPSLR